MGINGRQVDSPAWLMKLYWRSRCGRTLSPATDRCHNCGDSRPDPRPPVEVLSELNHPHGPTLPTILHAVIDELLPEQK